MTFNLLIHAAEHKFSHTASCNMNFPKLFHFPELLLISPLSHAPIKWKKKSIFGYIY